MPIGTVDPQELAEPLTKLRRSGLRITRSRHVTLQVLLAAAGPPMPTKIHRPRPGAAALED